MKTHILNFVRLLFRNRFFEFVFLKISPSNSLDSWQIKLLPNHYQYKINSHRTKTVDGIQYSLDIHNIVDWFIYFNIQEPARRQLNLLIEKSIVFYDIGANIGHVSLKASQLIKENGIIYSFEPHPGSYKRLSNHIALNSMSNIKAFNIGLGIENLVVNMLQVDGNAGANRVVTNEEITSNIIPINIVALDEFVLVEKCKTPDLIKVDVEGYELQVFKGAENLLRNFKPKLFFEVDENLLKLQGTSPHELLMYLSKFNYKFITADDNRIIDGKYDFTNCHIDVIASVDF